MNYPIKQLPKNELPLIKKLMAGFDLPVDDLETAPVLFYGIKNEEQLLAVGGLEIYGTDALIRSVAVADLLQGQGIGKELIQYLEQTAREQKITHLFLLTTTADRFFNQLGYSGTDRSNFPELLQVSSEFSSLCPASASCFVKPLNH